MAASKYISSAKELTFDKFQKIVIEGDLSLLIIEGKPSVTDLLVAWENIYWEYTNKIDDEFSKVVDDKIKVLTKRIKIDMVKAAVNILLWYNNKDLIEILKKFGFKGSFNFENDKEYESDLKRVLTQLKFWEMELPKEEEKAEKQVSKLDYDIFIIALTHLSKYLGYEVKAKDITTYEFAVRYSMMINELKLKNKPTKK